MLGALALVAALGLLPPPTGAVAASGKITVKIKTPSGVPANVTVRRAGKKPRILTKRPASKMRRFRLTLQTGRFRIEAPRFAFDGALYSAAVSRPRFKLRNGRRVRLRVAYHRLPTARNLHVESVAADEIALAWRPPRGRKVQLRRRSGDRAPTTIRQGIRISGGRSRARDSGLRPGSEYSYGLFTRTKSKRKTQWVGPLALTVGTVSTDPAAASYAAPSSTVIVARGERAKPKVNATGVAVALAPGQPTPVIGSGFVLPVSAELPTGYLGRVVAVSTDGRTVELAPAGLADAFDFYFVDGRLDQLGPIALEPSSRSGDQPTARSSGLRICPDPGAGGGSSVTFKPVIDPSGHFKSALIKKGFLGLEVPHKATFDLSAQLKVGITADVDVEAALTCGLPLKKISKTLVLTPVPIAMVFEPIAQVGIGGRMEAQNIGYNATGGFWARGEIGSSNSITGGLIKNASPTTPSQPWSVGLSMTFGGELTIGPGVGLDGAAGAVAGVGGKFFPVKATFGPVFDDPEVNRDGCLKTEIAIEAALNVNAKVWGPWVDWSEDFTIDALNTDHTYGGPWYLPTDCEKRPDPSSDVLGSGIKEVSSSTTGDIEQWGHMDGFAPGENAWILSTGKVSDASIDDPNYFASTNLENPGSDLLSALVDGLDTYDAASYKTVVKPSGDTLHLRYVFASEEYPEYVGAGYDDVMAVLVDGTNCAQVPGTTDHVSVDAVNAYTNAEHFVNNEDGAAGYRTSMNGLTVPLTCSVPVTPGKPVTLEIAVADTGDHVYDSAVGLPDGGVWSD
ncbi:MAG TPA: choice-of-anchor L domain-containing protein [Thermoleophilaceae bacterium]|nr:choice-of-anchor L domain-containing protein [Thermoleophilaceae bacterium]